MRTKLKSEQYCFRLWHSASVLALQYFTLQIFSSLFLFGQECVIVHFWQLHCVKGLGLALLCRNGSMSIQMKGKNF